MVIHLLTNASVFESPATFQKNVYAIHSLGLILPLIEWTFIFIPILFHAIFGVLIIRGGLPNSSTYKYTSNIRYTLQRATGMIAFVFIVWHVFHMHGWIHADWWTKGVAQPLFGGMFSPYNAASSSAEAMRISWVVPILYAVGVLSCVFHLANGIWTFGITWGLWVTPAAQRWANWVCAAFGVLLTVVSLTALGGFAAKVDIKQAREIENAMYEHKVAAKEIEPNEHKRAHQAASPQQAAVPTSNP
jgi:succinate dehydrogenase / fumarate reductase cytochrome b subunit